MSVVPVLAVLHDAAASDGSAVARLAARVASALVQEGAGWPALAAACLAARGIAGDLEQAAWAARLGLPLALVEAAEAGEVPPRQIPPLLMHAADQAWPSWRSWPARLTSA